MTMIAGNTLIIYDEKLQQCDVCGKIDELRPYGPNGACICFECGMKNPESTEAAFSKLIRSAQ